MRSRNLTVALVGIVLLMVLTTGSTVQAQGDTGIRISPPNFELEGEPGQVVAQQITVTNRGSSPIPINMQVSGFEAVGQAGQAALTEATPAAFGIVSWTSVTPDQFQLDPDQRQAVTFLIEIPEDAPPGGHYVSVLASVSTAGATQGLAVGQRIGSLILLKVAGEVIEQAQVAELNAPAVASKGPIDFTAVLRNSGNVHLRPAGFISIKGTFGGEITNLQLEQSNVLPRSERAFSATWDTGWRIGVYTAEYTAFYGTENASVTKSVTVIIFPWPIALPVLVVLLVLIFLVFKARQRLGRTVRVLMGSE